MIRLHISEEGGGVSGLLGGLLGGWVGRCKEMVSFIGGRPLDSGPECGRWFEGDGLNLAVEGEPRVMVDGRCGWG